MMSSGEPANGAVMTGTPGVAAHRRRPALGERWYTPTIIIATVLAAANALVGIGADSVARDEGFSISTSLRSWSSLVHLSLYKETNAWLYAVVLKMWSSVGTTPGALRIPSAVAFTVTVPLVAELGRRLYSRRVGALAAVLVAFNGSLLMYSQQIRGYAFGVAAAMAATLVFVSDVARPRRATLVGWVALVVLAAQFQLHTVTMCVVHVASLLALEPARRLWRRRLGALAVGLAVIVPMAIVISRHEEGQGLFSLGSAAFLNVFNLFAGRGGVPGALAFVVAGAVVLLFAVRSWRAGDGDHDERLAPSLLLAWIAVPFLLLLTASIVLNPTLVGRYLLFCVPALVIALAVVIDRLVGVRGRRRPVALVAAVLLALAGAGGTLSWHVDSQTEHWDQAAAYVFANARADDRLVLANDSIRLFFEYERTRHAVPVGPQPGYPSEPWGAYGPGDQRYESPTAAELASVASSASTRLWVVIGRDHVNTSVMDERDRALAPAFRLVDQRRFTGSIDVLLYERTAP